MFWSQSRTPEKCSGVEASADVNTSHGSERTDLKRALSGRHMQMIAIGGAIGTGLFVASGATVSTTGWCACGLHGYRPHGASPDAVAR